MLEKMDGDKCVHRLNWILILGEFWMVKRLGYVLLFFMEEPSLHVIG